MTIEEMEAKVLNFCGSRMCDKCPLSIGGWERPLMVGPEAEWCPAIARMTCGEQLKS